MLMPRCTATVGLTITRYFCEKSIKHLFCQILCLTTVNTADRSTFTVDFFKNILFFGIPEGILNYLGYYSYLSKCCHVKSLSTFYVHIYA